MFIILYGFCSNSLLYRPTVESHNDICLEVANIETRTNTWTLHNHICKSS